MLPTFDEETTDLIDSATRLQKDLGDVQLPRLRACAGPLVLQQTYAAEVREDIETLTRKVEALDLLVLDQRSEKSRRELRGVVNNYKEALVELRQESRAALLASKKAIDSQSKSRREELLKSSAITEKRKTNEKVTDDVLMKANNDVTEALRRTINLMQGELERSVLSTQLLDASSTSLKATSSAHDRLTDLMGTSKQLVKALEKTDWLDRMLIISAFVFFLLVVLFILQQRIISRGLRIAFWWTRFLADFSEDTKLLDLAKAAPTLSTVVSDSTILSSALSTSVVATTLSTSLTAANASSLIVDTLSPSSPLATERTSTNIYTMADSSLLTTTISSDAASSTPPILPPTHVEL